jgi:hypothetical protein
MNLALWIIARALVVVFALSGLMKLGVSKDKLVASSNMRWAGVGRRRSRDHLVVDRQIS